MEIDLKGKVAIVTGGGRGIGRAIARTLAKEQAVTIVTDVNKEDLKTVTAEFAEHGWNGETHLCDVRVKTQIQVLVEGIVERHGRVDILVNNAGVAAGGPVETLEESVWDANLDINLKGTFLMCQAVAPVMKQQKSGRIINAASFAAIVPRTGSAAYASSKAGVVSFTRVLAGELGPWDITVNCYAPGMIPTQMNHFAELPGEKQKALLDTLTLRRWGKPEEVANLICFLASDLASYITGTLIDCSGGKLTTQEPSEIYGEVGLL